MPDLDLSALRKVAEAATPGPWTVPGPDDEFLNPRDVCTDGEPGDRFVICEHAGSDAQYIATFDPSTVLALLGELENLRITAKADRQYVEEADDRMKPYLAKAWWEGVTAQWTHMPPGNRVPQSENPYRQASDG